MEYQTNPEGNTDYFSRQQQTGAPANPDAAVRAATYTAPPQQQAGATGTLRDAGIGTVQSVGAVGGSAVGATRDVLNGAIGATEQVGSGLVGGVTHVATDIVHGVRDVGVEVKDGAATLIHAAGDLGGSTVHTVADLLVEVVGGVRRVVGAVVGATGLADMARKSDGERALEREREHERAELGTRPPPVQTTQSDSRPYM
jgi:hypothetical protein